MFVPNFKILGEVVPEKSVTKNYLMERKNEQIKGMISMRVLILSYTIQEVIANVCFVCVEVLWPSQPNGVMSSAVSLPNHTFTGQA